GDVGGERDRSGYAAAGLDRVDGLGLRIVEEFERRPARVEGDDPPGLRTPVDDLLEPERIAVERQRLVEVLHRERDTQLSHTSHSPFLTKPLNPRGAWSNSAFVHGPR